MKSPLKTAIDNRHLPLDLPAGRANGPRSIGEAAKSVVTQLDLRLGKGEAFHQLSPRTAKAAAKKAAGKSEPKSKT
ncbi:MAG: hypothetical protein ACOVQ6_03840, partial [Brevundimonas sp.]